MATLVKRANADVQPRQITPEEARRIIEEQGQNKLLSRLSGTVSGIALLRLLQRRNALAALNKQDALAGAVGGQVAAQR